MNKAEAYARWIQATTDNGFDERLEPDCEDEEELRQKELADEADENFNLCAALDALDYQKNKED
jgi:hypothetical protein